jgi:hypothetical protein
VAVAQSVCIVKRGSNQSAALQLTKLAHPSGHEAPELLVSADTSVAGEHRAGAAGADICGVRMGAFGDPDSVVALVMWQMASGPGKCQLWAVPDPSADSFRVSPLSMGDPCVLSGVPGALCGVESVELPLFRDAGSPLVAGAVPYALGAKYSRGSPSWRPAP